jgi:hypothetical protein
MHLLVDERCGRAIEFADRYADRLVKRQELALAHSDISAACRTVKRCQTCGTEARRAAMQAVFWATHPTKRSYAGSVADSAAAAVTYAAFPANDPWLFTPPADDPDRWERTHRDECAAQMLLARDVVGNPFRHVIVKRSWLKWGDGTILNLARSIYDERAFDRLAVLADALEDAGCDDAAILGHLRGPGPHVRGCWVLDWILGKT